MAHPSEKSQLIFRRMLILMSINPSRAAGENMWMNLEEFIRVALKEGYIFIWGEPPRYSEFQQILVDGMIPSVVEVLEELGFEAALQDGGIRLDTKAKNYIASHGFSWLNHKMGTPFIPKWPN